MGCRTMHTVQHKLGKVRARLSRCEPQLSRLAIPMSFALHMHNVGRLPFKFVHKPTHGVEGRDLSLPVCDRLEHLDETTSEGV